jgi:hypothetical protein
MSLYIVGQAYLLIFSLYFLKCTYRKLSLLKKVTGICHTPFSIANWVAIKISLVVS